MILNDKQIKKLAEEEGMTTPFLDKSVSNVLILVIISSYELFDLELFPNFFKTRPNPTIKTIMRM